VKPQLANCDRCGRQLQVSSTRREDSAPFRRAKVPKGVCPECVMTQFLYNTYPVNMLIDEAGPEILLNAEFMRMAFTQAGIMERCEMYISEVNWQRVVDNWKLPVKVTRDGRNPYRMGDSPRAGKGRDGKLPRLGFGSRDLSGSLTITVDPKTGKPLANGQPMDDDPELADAMGGLLGALKKQRENVQ
jgi:hypothetical protein